MGLRAALITLGMICALSSSLLAQSPPATNSTKPASPIQTQFKAFKVHFGKDGKEELEPASGVSPGDVVEYVAMWISRFRFLGAPRSGKGV
jgi:hypothetical protein